MLKTGEMGSWGDLGRFNLKTGVSHTNQESRQVCKSFKLLYIIWMNIEANEISKDLMIR